MNTVKVLALAREAGYSTQIDVRNGLHTENIWGGELETAKVMRFAALIQREMEADQVNTDTVSVPREFHGAVKWLVIAARTSGGTAGRDVGLCDACDAVESLLLAAQEGKK